MTSRLFGWSLVGLLVGSFTAGCSSNSDADLVAANQAGVLRRYSSVHNGTYGNGIATNGKKTNGKKTNGKKTNGKKINGVDVQGGDDTGPVLVGIEEDTNLVMTGADFVGAELTAHLSDGTTELVKVHAFDNTSVPGEPIYLVKFVADGEPICGYKDGQPIWASVVPQIFNPTTGEELAEDLSMFTFGCRGYGIQKCQEYGYPKNQKKKERSGGTDRNRSMNDYHASCVRMVRADYCGDGTPHTFDGTSIDIYDHLLDNNSIATSTDGSDGYYFEAEWDSDGAHCINKTRWMPNTQSGLTGNQNSANPDYEYIRLNCPERFAFPVPKAGGGMSTPDRACSSSSKWNTSVGWSQYAADTANQVGRAKIRNNSQLYTYTP